MVLSWRLGFRLGCQHWGLGLLTSVWDFVLGFEVGGGGLDLDFRPGGRFKILD